MLKEKINYFLEGLTGDFGVYVVNQTGEKVISIGENELFPLASAAKLAIGAVTALIVGEGQLKWEQMLANVQFEQKNNAHEVFPHLLNVDRLRLEDVTEVMIGCHDNNCADAISSIYGGWVGLSQIVKSYYPTLQVDKNPRDLVNNVGTLQDLSKVLLDINRGFKQNLYQWKPVISGMVRQMDKDPEDAPLHHHANMTGGLPNCFIYMGIVGELTSKNVLLYVIAGNNLPDRRDSSAADDAATNIFRLIYNESMTVKQRVEENNWEEG